MTDQTANYTAFCVAEPKVDSNLGYNTAGGLRYLNQLKAWKKLDPSFPFEDAHSETYSVRDDSSKETLIKRLHERLRLSKNIILFLESETRNTDALREEMNYGICCLNLPVIVVYPEFVNVSDIYYLGKSGKSFKSQIKSLWNILPAFRDNMDKVATLHIPYKKDYIARALINPGFTLQHMTKPGRYFIKE